MKIHKPNCMANVACAVFHADGVCPGPYGKCTRDGNETNISVPMPPNTKKCCSECCEKGHNHANCAELKYGCDCPRHTPTPVISIQIAGDEITTNNTCNCGMTGTHKISENCGVLQQSLRKYPTPEKEKCGKAIEITVKPDVIKPSKCGRGNGMMWCYCGKCKPDDYPVPNDLLPTIEKKCEDKHCASNTAFNQFGCTCTTTTSAVEKSEHDGTCRTPECYEKRPTPAVEDWEDRYKTMAVFETYSVPNIVIDDTIDFIRSLLESDRKWIIDGLEKIKKERTNDEYQDEYPAGYNQAITDAITLITNLK